MCGFFGSFSINGNSPINVDIYKDITLEHRGPDDHRIFKDKVFYSEFFRLSILGGSSAQQPMRSFNNKYIMLFNGEIYNYKELAKEYLSLKSNTFGDSRVLLELFSKFGLKAIEKLNGMFAIVIYDQINRKVLLIRDRFGTKPLYYTIYKIFCIFHQKLKLYLFIKK